jgi:putative selenate reductase YgfK subunit
MDEKRISREDFVVAPCTEACPAGVDVPRYIRCIKEGRFDEALAVMRERIPFPAVCGYACYSPCEAHCGNRQFGEPISIRALHRAAYEKGGEHWRKNLNIAPETGKRVAIVGSGPSGLTAAYYLATLGHQVTVFEALDRLGGMMRMGIPEYRLSREALDKEINYIKDMGVEMKTGHRVDSVDQLFEEGYDAAYIALGAQKGARLGIPGDDVPSVMDGISFLRQVNEGKTVEIGNRVAVIGGGNSAIDAARSAVRLGAKEVTVFYRRTKAEMTAYEEEVEAATCEGIKIEFLTAPVQVAQEGERLALRLTRMKLGKPDASGRPRPIPVEGSEFNEEFDTVITAVGQVADIDESMGLPLSEKSLVQVDHGTLVMDKPGVFAGGDIVSGPASIIEAIAQGREGASDIDRYLGGKGMIDQDLASPETHVLLSKFERVQKPRVQMRTLDLEQSLSCFEQVERGLDEEQATEEASRCLNCDARQFEVTVYGDNCKECGYCIEVCGLNIFVPSDHFNQKGYKPVMTKNETRCVGCLKCFFACPDYAIDVNNVRP